jgi:hypothetical protein
LTATIRTTIFHHPKEGLAPVVLCMQGRKVVMQVEVDPAKGYSHKVRFFNVPAGRTDKGKAIFDEKKDVVPEILVDGKPLELGPPVKVGFDGQAHPHLSGEKWRGCHEDDLSFDDQSPGGRRMEIAESREKRNQGVGRTRAHRKARGGIGAMVWQ